MKTAHGSKIGKFLQCDPSPDIFINECSDLVDIGSSCGILGAAAVQVL